MIRISCIASYLPELRLSTIERAALFGYEPSFLDEKLGTLSISLKDEGEETSDLCVKAARRLEELSISLNGVDAVVVCTQSPDGNGIPHTSAVVHSKLGLGDDCACFDISLGCSGYVYGLSIVKSFMEANNLRRGLFFTSDPYSKVVDPEDQSTCLLFGDAATVTLLTNDGVGYSLVDSVFATRGSGGAAINNDSGKLRMEGRDVFNFALTSVPKQVKALLEKADLEIKDVDSFIFHQGSRYIVEKIRQRMGLDEEKAPVYLSGFGNTVSSAIPLTFENVLLTSQPEKVVMAGFGVGLSYASVLLERTK